MRPHTLLQATPRRQARCAALLLLAALLAGAPAFAVSITGTVTNGTTGKPAGGDAVVLIALNQSMQELTRTTTDAAGHFSIQAPDPGMHLIRVDHQGAAYFQPAPPNTPNVNVNIFDVAAQVPGVSTEANVLRMETDQQGLQVTQSYFVKNASDPPRTQFSDHSYEIYLPPGAQLEGSAAMGPEGMPVRSSPVPLKEKNRYAFLFPLRPGQTRFQITYHIPYSGNLSFSPRLPSAEENFVVMLPNSMTFKPGPKSPFQQIDQPAGVQTFLARNVTPAQSLEFSVSGSGAMPRDTAAAGADQGGASGSDAAAGQAGTSASADQGSPDQGSAADTRPGIGLAKPIDTPDPLNKYKWWILAGIGLIFAIGAAFLLRAPQGSPADSGLSGGAGKEAAKTEGTLLSALKDEMFALEADRVQGKLSEGEYGELKSALELILRRALSRQAA